MTFCCAKLICLAIKFIQAIVLLGIMHQVLPFHNLAMSLVLTAGILFLEHRFVAWLTCAGVCLVWFAFVPVLAVTMVFYR